MKQIGTYEAKTHLSQLIEEAAQGESILITHRGKPAALLGPAEISSTKGYVNKMVSEMLAYRDTQKRTLGGLTINEMREEGRR